MLKKHFYGAVATLTGTIIGAGVLGMPYVVAKAGFLTGLANLVVLGAAVMVLYLFLGEVVLRTRGNHQLPGYAEIYLGKTGKRLMVFAMIFGIYGALLAYIIGEGKALSAIFGANDPLFFSLAFFAAASFLLHKGLRAIEESEAIMSTLVIVIIALISAIAFAKVDFSSLPEFNPTLIFLPYGVILFSLAGSVAIPEMKEEMSHHKELLKKAIMIGALIPIILYIIFCLVIVGSTGANTTEVATVGLSQIVGHKMFLLGNFFAVLAMATSFLTLGLALKEMYHYDFHIKEGCSLLLTVLPPLALFFFLHKGFVEVIGITGGVAMGVEGILIVLMYRSAKLIGGRKPEYQMARSRVVEYGIMLVFAMGIVYTLLNLFKII